MKGIREAIDEQRKENHEEDKQGGKAQEEATFDSQVFTDEEGAIYV